MGLIADSSEKSDRPNIQILKKAPDIDEKVLHVVDGLITIVPGQERIFVPSG